MTSHNLKIYQDERIVKQAGADVYHGFFSRIGGVSKGIYAGLNCGIGSHDKSDHVAQNRQRVAQHFNVDECSLLSPYQVHGNGVFYVDNIWSDRPHADALVTDKRDTILSIVTADCAPVLFYGYKHDGNPIIAAAHAGWKGALSGVLDNAIAKMVQYGAGHESIRVVIGPCIARDSYEVHNAFMEPFIEHNSESERFFYGGSSETHCFFDLAAYCAWRLSLAHIKQISILDCDTYKNEKEFYSYRRSTHHGENDYGRQISAISIIKK